MAHDITEYVSTCSTCAPNKGSNKAAAGLLRPLPMPGRSWSYISMDFVTGLPESEANTAILRVVDHFSKMVHFIPVPKLSSAKETVEIILHQVVHLHGFPLDIVSDRGPQFVSQFWKAFCSLVGAAVSLSSGYHHQSNGQTERLNQELEKELRCLLSQVPTQWCKNLTSCVWGVCNTSMLCVYLLFIYVLYVVTCCILSS